MKDRVRAGFTLIEMKVVIAVIAVLCGMLFLLMQNALRSAKKADTIARLERISHALNEYRAKYGNYPSASSCPLAVPDFEYSPPWLNGIYLPKTPDYPGPLFIYGMASFIYPRDAQSAEWCTTEYQWGIDSGVRNHKTFIPDTPEDLEAKKHWWPFLDGIPVMNVDTLVYNALEYGAGMNCEYMLAVYAPVDGWYTVNDRNQLDSPKNVLNWIHYNSRPPYKDYRLWSLSEDGISGTGDDIHYKGWDE